MAFPHLASYFSLSALLVVFFLAFRLVLSFLAAGKATSSKRLPPGIGKYLIPLVISLTCPDLPFSVDAPEMHVISEALEIVKYVVSIVEGSLRRFRRFWKTRAQGFLLAVLKAGPIPGHIALIMDGNRRYALTKHMTLKEGYEEGATSLSRVGVLLLLASRSAIIDLSNDTKLGARHLPSARCEMYYYVLLFNRKLQANEGRSRYVDEDAGDQISGAHSAWVNSTSVSTDALV